jgi:glutamyl/glutaminyl-tRNA synthetase
MAGRKFRFAPSPNGRLHPGHAYSALFSWQQARLLDGECLLRIEDIDTFRCKQEFVDGIYEDLAWLGLTWPEPVRRQSKHFHEYTSIIDRLERLRLLYPCFCTRAKLNAHEGPKDPDGATVYPGHCRLMTRFERQRRMAAGEPYALRLDMAKAIVAAGENLVFTELGEGPAVRPAKSDVRRKDGETWCWPARTSAPAIMLRWCTTTHCKALPTSPAGRTCFTQHPFIGYCNRYWSFHAPAISITA